LTQALLWKHMGPRSCPHSNRNIARALETERLV
jgi:hypothetical protein